MRALVKSPVYGLPPTRKSGRHRNLLLSRCGRPIGDDSASAADPDAPVEGAQMPAGRGLSALGVTFTTAGVAIAPLPRRKRGDTCNSTITVDGGPAESPHTTARGDARTARPSSAYWSRYSCCWWPAARSTWRWATPMMLLGFSSPSPTFKRVGTARPLRRQRR